MREIILDTETTGFEPEEGHRVIEIAAIEVINLLPTGRHFHTLLDPERDVPAESTRIHGFTASDLVGKPRFGEKAAEMLAFLGDSPIVAHNAPFDFKHLDAELARIGRPPLGAARMVDSLAIARERFPGAPNSLDALCRRFDIDLSERTTHNALLDVRLLAQAYLELRGGRQLGLGLGAAPVVQMFAREQALPRTPRPIAVTPEAQAAHEAFLAKIKDPIWSREG
jgi:DNA polymerase-3 subunit epsilon